MIMIELPITYIYIYTYIIICTYYIQKLYRHILYNIYIIIHVGG